MEKDLVKYKDRNGVVRGIISFQYPQFEGKSSSIKKINKRIKTKSKEFFESDTSEYFRRCVQDNIAAYPVPQYTNPTYYHWTASCKESYNKNGIVSFYMSEDWYAGGVGSYYKYGLNYNLKTGRELSVKDVVSGNAKVKILKAGKKYCKKIGFEKGYDTIRRTKKYKFYFKRGKVYICYGTYELGHATASDDRFSVKGKYK